MGDKTEEENRGEAGPVDSTLVGLYTATDISAVSHVRGSIDSRVSPAEG